MVLLLLPWVLAFATKSQPPHLILIVADDLGRADVGTADPTVISPVQISIQSSVLEFIAFIHVAIQ